MMNTLAPNKIPTVKKLIIAVSIVIPLVVGALFRIRIPGDLSFLPPIYAGFNAATALLLILALFMVKQGKIELHRFFIRLALLLSLLFLVCYVAYHLTSDPTQYGDLNHDHILSDAEKASAGTWRTIYFVTLISHIGLSMVVIPMVLYAYLFAWAGQYEAHKKLVRFAYPIWLYVAITGVVVYWMISPFYR
jgi:putative membrane protein